MVQFIPPTSLTDSNYKQLLQQCVHCGLCLPACPTYAVFGTEMDAPRGRIALMRVASEGRIGLGGEFEEHISLCLGCRACETACPSGVQYGTLVETARIAMEKVRRPGVLERFVRWSSLRKMLPTIGSLRLLARLLRVYEGVGLQHVLRRFNFLPRRLQTVEALLPPLSTNYMDYRHEAPAIGPKHGTVAFFHGCVQEAFLCEINKATIRVLQRNGYEVIFPRGQ